VADGRNRPLMLITGDSSFLFHIAELETAARLNLPLVCVVAADYAWGLSTDTRLDKVAAGFGCNGEYAERAEDIARPSSVPLPAAGPGSFTWPSTRRPIPRRCRATPSSVPGTPKECSDLLATPSAQ
jgi:hypothetical protein